MRRRFQMMPSQPPILSDCHIDRLEVIGNLDIAEHLLRRLGGGVSIRLRDEVMLGSVSLGQQHDVKTPLNCQLLIKHLADGLGFGFPRRIQLRVMQEVDNDIVRHFSADEVDEKIEQIETIRDFESFLREAAQLSKRQSGWLLSKAKAVIASDSQRDSGLKAHDELAAILGRINNGLK